MNPTLWKAFLSLHAHSPLLCISRPRGLSALHPSTLWLQPAQGLDYPLSQSFAAPAWDWGTLGSKGKVLCDLSRGWWGLAISPCSAETNPTLACPWPAGPSHSGHTDKPGIDPDRLNQGHQHRQTHCCCTLTSPSHLPHRRKGSTVYDFNV